MCVTGGAGFIGGHLIEALGELGCTVVVIDDLSNNDGRHVCRFIDEHARTARFVYGSILDWRALRDAMAGAEFVFHLAAVNSVSRSIDDPERAFEVNAMGTVRVAEAARKAGVTRLVYAASSSAYGDDPGLPKVESALPRPISPYGASKLAGESVVAAWSRSFGLSGVSLRLFNVFGPRQAAGGPYAAVIPAFIGALLKGDRPEIFGDGSASRDFTPVACAVRAFLLAGAAKDLPPGAVINIGGGRRTTILDLARQLAGHTDRPRIEPRLVAARAGDVAHSLADLTLARSLIGYEPHVSFEEGLSRTVRWFTEEADRMSREPATPSA